MASFRLTVIRADRLLSFEELCFRSLCLLLKIQRNRNRTRGRGKRANPNVQVKATAVPKCATPCLRSQLYLGRQAQECLSSEDVELLADLITLHGRLSLHGIPGSCVLISSCLAVSEWRMRDGVLSTPVCMCPILRYLQKKRPHTTRVTLTAPEQPSCCCIFLHVLSQQQHHCTIHTCIRMKTSDLKHMKSSLSLWNVFFCCCWDLMLLLLLQLSYKAIIHHWNKNPSLSGML